MTSSRDDPSPSGYRSTPLADPARRDLLAWMGLAGVGSWFSVEAGMAATTPGVASEPTAQAIALYARLVGDLSGRVTLTYSAGTVWGFRPQADDLALADFVRRLYGYRSLVARKVRRLPNGDLAIRQQAWTFYADPDTDAITTTLRNPYTGVDVQPYSPPSAPWETAYRSDGTTYVPGREDANPLGTGQSTVFDRPFDLRTSTIGATTFVHTSQFIRFQPANIDWWKLEATLVSYACRSADIANARMTHVPSTSTMNLVAEWQTWMDMHGSPGHILFKGEGASIDSIADVPADCREALARRFAGQLEQALAW